MGCSLRSREASDMTERLHFHLKNDTKADAGRDWGQEEKTMTEDEMAGWHHQLDGHEFE